MCYSLGKGGVDMQTSLPTSPGRIEQDTRTPPRLIEISNDPTPSACPRAGTIFFAAVEFLAGAPPLRAGRCAAGPRPSAGPPGGPSCGSKRISALFSNVRLCKIWKFYMPIWNPNG